MAPAGGQSQATDLAEVAAGRTGADRTGADRAVTSGPDTGATGAAVLEEAGEPDPH
jgi:hypothetical protein